MAARKTGHQWEDDGLRVGGRAWQHGVRFVCSRCGLDRRKIEEGQNRYYLLGKKVGSDTPCLS